MCIGSDVRLSPMAGFTNAPMRTMSLKFGATKVYTEMAGVAGLSHGNNKETWQLLETFPEEDGKVIAHLYGSDPKQFGYAAELIAKTGRFIGIDINAGCPVPKITASGAGSALMADPKKLGECVKSAISGSGLPVSVKTRIGFKIGEVTIFKVLEIIEAAGASELAIHGRYKCQGHAGEVDHEIVAKAKAMTSIPVYGNGGIRDAASALDYEQKTSVDGLLIGQGAIGHPWIFEEIRNGISFNRAKSRSEYLSLREIREQLFTHLNLEYRFAKHCLKKYSPQDELFTAETVTVIRFRVHLFNYLSGLKGSSYLRGIMATFKTIDDCKRAVDLCLERERVFRHSRRR